MIEKSVHTLSNGLRVVHHRDMSSGHVALNVLYNVGSRDEDPQLTGMAHLLEHMMFEGSANVPDYDMALERAGATNNAWTNTDFTNFYVVLPRKNIETAMWVESDRMMSATLSDESLEVQRKVVIEEFKQTCLNRPYGDMGHKLRRLIYKVHPYRFPTIGKSVADIEKATATDVRQFYARHYSPNNAVISIAGPIDEDKAISLVEKWFGSIEPRSIAPRNLPKEPEQTQEKRLEVEAAVPQNRIVMAVKMAAHSNPDYKVADLITDILASGQSARFTQELVLGKNLFTHADASISGSDDEGFLMLNGHLRDNSEATLRAAEKAFRNQMQKIATKKVSNSELGRALNKFESTQVFSNIGCEQKATRLALDEMQGTDVNQTIAEYRTITADDIQRVASELFAPHRINTLIYRGR